MSNVDKFTIGNKQINVKDSVARNQIVSANQSIAQNFNSIQQLNVRSANLETEVSAVRQKANTNETNINSLSLRTSANESSITVAQTNINNVSSNLADTNSEVAVLKERMDEFASLPEGSTSGNAELLDIRVGGNGITYSSAGDAVRGQYDELSEFISDKGYSIRRLYDGGDILTINNKEIIAYGQEFNSNNHVCSDFILIHSGDTVYYNLTGTDPSVVLVCEYNLDKTYRNVIAQAVNASTPVTGTYTAPADAYLRFSCRREYPAVITINNGSTVSSDVQMNIFENVGKSKGILNLKDLLPLQNNCIRASNGELVPSTNYWYSDYIRVMKGDVLSYSLRGSDNSIGLIAFYNNSKIWMHTIATGGANYQTDVIGTYTFQRDGFIRMCNRKDNPNGYTVFNGGISNGIRDYVNEHATSIPDYWYDTVVNKINTYNQKNELVGKNGTSFVFISDTHWSANAKHSNELINYICNHSNMDMIVHGGDFVVNSLNNIRDFINSIEKPIDILPCIGNHEYDNSLAYTNAQIWSCGFKRSEYLYSYNQGFNYCFDNQFQRIRFIVLDYNDSNAVTYFSNKMSELPSGWTAILVCHEYWGDRTSASDPLTPSAIGNALVNVIDSNYDSWNATLACYLCGHTHQDINATTAKGVPIICINCDAYDDGQSYNWGGYKMNLGTTTEQCFDLVNIDTLSRKIYMTRVGAGSDREFSF